MWESGEIIFNGEKYHYDAKVYDLPSKYGIDKGRISKLCIFAPNGRYVAEYEREWIIKPTPGSNDEKILDQVLDMYKVKEDI